MNGIDPKEPILRKKLADIELSKISSDFNKEQLNNMLKFIIDINKTKKGPHLVGLSANQIGMDIRACVVNFALRTEDKPYYQLFINPNIIWYSKSKIRRYEGCLNLKDIYGVIERSEAVRFAALDRYGGKYEVKVSGWQAILIQHEVDHLNGKLFIDRLDDPKKAHLVKPREIRSYKDNYLNWKKFVDVSKFL